MDPPLLRGKLKRTTSPIGHSFSSLLLLSGCCRSPSQNSSLVHPHPSSHLLQPRDSKKTHHGPCSLSSLWLYCGLLGLQLHLSHSFLLPQWVLPTLWLYHHPCSHWVCLGLLSPQLPFGSFSSALAHQSSNLVSSLPVFFSTWHHLRL